MFNVNENTVLVFENVDLNVCGGYDNTTGNVTLYCKNVDLNVCGGYNNTTGNVTLWKRKSGESSIVKIAV